MTGGFQVTWAPTAWRSLNRVPAKTAAAVIEFAHGSLSANPTRVGRPLRFDLEGLHVARRGDYRAVYRIDANRRTVTIVAVAHRSDAYRPR